MKIWTIVFILSLFIFQACQRESGNPSNHEEVTQEALNLMYKGQNNEAIELLTKEQNLRPTERTQVLLASAYANRAGVKVESYWGFWIGYDNFLKSKLFGSTNESDDADEILKDIPAEVQKSVQEFVVNVRSLYKIKKRLLQIPLVDEAQQKDINSAILSLSGVQSSGARLYRAVLNLVLFRTAVENSYILLMDTSKNPSLNCKNNLSQSLEWLTYSTELFQDVLADTLVAFPSSENEINNLQLQSDDLLKNLAKYSAKVEGLLCKK